MNLNTQIPMQGVPLSDFNEQNIQSQKAKEGQLANKQTQIDMGDDQAVRQLMSKPTPDMLDENGQLDVNKAIPKVFAKSPKMGMQMYSAAAVANYKNSLMGLNGAKAQKEYGQAAHSDLTDIAEAYSGLKADDPQLQEKLIARSMPLHTSGRYHDDEMPGILAAITKDPKMFLEQHLGQIEQSKAHIMDNVIAGKQSVAETAGEFKALTQEEKNKALTSTQQTQETVDGLIKILHPDSGASKQERKDAYIKLSTLGKGGTPAAIAAVTPDIGGQVVGFTGQKAEASAVGQNTQVATEAKSAAKAQISSAQNNDLNTQAALKAVQLFDGAYNPSTKTFSEFNPSQIGELTIAAAKLLNKGQLSDNQISEIEQSTAEGAWSKGLAYLGLDAKGSSDKNIKSLLGMIVREGALAENLRDKAQGGAKGAASFLAEFAKAPYNMPDSTTHRVGEVVTTTKGKFQYLGDGKYRKAQ